MAKNAYLILANGKVFAGKSFGADGEVIGELVFSTGMTGYIEALTDPSYFGQIVVSTFPSIGNYGIIAEDCENQCSYLKAYVVREWCQDPSNFRCEGDLDTFLKLKKRCWSLRYRHPRTDENHPRRRCYERKDRILSRSM